MTRKATRRKHHPGLHPLDAITANQPFPPADLTRILLKVHSAFEHLRTGGADPDQFDRMAAVLNVGLVRCEAIGQQGVEVFKSAQAALMAADARLGDHGKYGFSGPELQAMRDAVGLYEDLIRASTPRQMEQVQQECMRRVRAGHFEQAQASTRIALEES